MKSPYGAGSRKAITIYREDAFHGGWYDGAMAAKRTGSQSPAPINPKQELFCQLYTQSHDFFGNATLSYAAAFDYNLAELSQEPERVQDTDDDDEGVAVRTKTRMDSPYQRAYNVCSVQAHKLLRIAKVQVRIRELLNALLKDEIVDSELAKLIMQGDDNTAKVAAIREYNKLRSRIVDRSESTIKESFTVDDIRALLSPLPQERQDEIYATITNAIAEAELLRGGTKV